MFLSRSIAVNARSMTMKTSHVAPALLALSLATAPVWAAPHLLMNGHTVSTKVETLNGRAYVPLADIARALGLVVVKVDGGYELKKPGGASPIRGVTQGKIGDVLFDGSWRFQVTSIGTPNSFTMKTPADYSDNGGTTQFDPKTRTFVASNNYRLVVLQCRVTNAMQSKRTLWTALTDATTHTALTDQDGGSHPPVAFDFEGGTIQSKPLVPGEILRFPMLFSVPQDARVTGLIFTLKDNQTDLPARDVRVSLRLPAQ